MRRLAMLAGVIAVAVIGPMLLAPADLTRSWLVTVHAALGLPLGAMAILMMHTLTGGHWGEALRPGLVAIAAALPLVMLAFLPLFAGIHVLLPFLSQAPGQLPERVAAKLGYLAPHWIVLRTIAVFAAWLFAAALIDVLPWPRTRASKRGAVIGLVLYMLGLMVFSTDWMQALEPETNSTIYPVLVAGEQLLGAFAAALLVAPPSPERSNDLAKLLLAAVLTWIYFAYMQWLISWMGNLPPEAAWYVRRMQPSWLPALVLMIAGLGLVPFLALLSKRVRQDPRSLRLVAGVVVVGYFASNLWRVGAAFPLSPTYFAMLAGCHAVLAAAAALLIVPWHHAEPHHG